MNDQEHICGDPNGLCDAECMDKAHMGEVLRANYYQKQMRQWRDAALQVSSERDTLHSRIAELEAALAEAREDSKRLQRAREILFAYTDNEITADPWWCVVRNGSFGRMVVLEGPFFSRERAEALRNARLYEYGAKSYVYCFSGHRSQHYKELRVAIGAPDRAAIDAARKEQP